MAVTVKGTLKVIAGVAIALLIAWVLTTMNDLQAADAKQVTRGELEQQNIELAAVVKELREERRQEIDEAIQESEERAAQSRASLLPFVPGVQFVPVPGEPGEDGADGEPGTDGADGAPGAQGPMPPLNVVQQFVDEAIATICADDACDGPKGDSIKGDPGRGIETTTCSDEDRFVIHYTDGEVEEVEDSRCRIPLLPITDP